MQNEICLSCLQHVNRLHELEARIKDLQKQLDNMATHPASGVKQVPWGHM